MAASGAVRSLTWSARRSTANRSLLIQEGEAQGAACRDRVDQGLQLAGRAPWTIPAINAAARSRESQARTARSDCGQDGAGSGAGRSAPTRVPDRVDPHDLGPKPQPNDRSRPGAGRGGVPDTGGGGPVAVRGPSEPHPVIKVRLDSCSAKTSPGRGQPNAGRAPPQSRPWK
jgi:hypothetical protein